MTRRRSAIPRGAAALYTLVALAAGAARADPPSYQFEALASRGAPAPTGDAFQGDFHPGAIGSEGDVAYVARVGDPGGQALFLDTVDAVFTVAAPGMPAAEGWSFAEKPGVLGGIASPVSMSAAGDILFAADLTRGDQTGAGTFLWQRDQQSLTAISLPGQMLSDGTLLGNARTGAGISSSGDIATAVDLAVAGGDPEPGIVLLSQGKARVIVRPGDPEPGGGTFLRAGFPSVNGKGGIAFQADVRRDGVISTALFLWDGARFVTVADDGTATPDGQRLSAAREPHLNDQTDLAFTGDSGEEAVYLSETGRLSRVAGPGTMLPFGARAGTVVTGAGSLALNQKGALAMVLKLAGQDAAGLFLYQRGALWAAAMPGTILAGIGPIDNVGPAIAMSESGQVAFQAELAGGDVALVLATPVLGG